jgi:CspA family cold shock protein
MATGKIKFFNRKRGFGFIIDDETQSDIFLHASGRADKKAKIKPKDSVSFDIIDDENGKKKAINIQKV